MSHHDDDIFACPTLQPPLWGSGGALGMHVPLDVSQALPGAQSLEVLQAFPHSPLSRQRYGVQSVETPSRPVDVS